MAFGPITDAQLFHKLYLLPKIPPHDITIRVPYQYKVLRPSIWIAQVHEPLIPTVSMDRPFHPTLLFYHQSLALLHTEIRKDQMKYMLGLAVEALHLRHRKHTPHSYLHQSHQYLRQAMPTVPQWRRQMAQANYLEFVSRRNHRQV